VVSMGYVAAARLPVGVDVGLSMPNLLVGVVALVVTLVVAVRVGSKTALPAGAGAALLVVGEMIWLADIYVTRLGSSARFSLAVLTWTNVGIAATQLAGMGLLVLAVAAVDARRWRRVAVCAAAVVLLVLVVVTMVGWYRGTTRIPYPWLEAPPIVVGVVGLALAALVARPVGRVPAVLTGLGSALWIVWGWCAVWYAAKFPGPHASADELWRFYQDTERLSELTALGNEVYVVRRLLTALTVGMVVLAVVTATRPRGPAPPLLPAGSPVRPFVLAAAFSLVLVAVAVVVGWVVGPGVVLPQAPAVPQ
jgi:hypothetical protein